MFVKENKHKLNMGFDTFLILLAKIAELKYADTTNSPAEALSLLLENHLLPLYDNIINETDLGEEKLKFKEPIDESALIILKDVVNIF